LITNSRNRVVRGGSFQSFAASAGSAFVQRAPAGGFSTSFGFRVARTIAAK
jgi:formylglycine-generating enzyme required for sulfatase activity